MAGLPHSPLITRRKPPLPNKACNNPVTHAGKPPPRAPPAKRTWPTSSQSGPVWPSVVSKQGRLRGRFEWATYFRFVQVPSKRGATGKPSPKPSVTSRYQIDARKDEASCFALFAQLEETAHGRFFLCGVMNRHSHLFLRPQRRKQKENTDRGFRSQTRGRAALLLPASGLGETNSVCAKMTPCRCGVSTAVGSRQTFAKEVSPYLKDIM